MTDDKMSNKGVRLKDTIWSQYTIGSQYNVSFLRFWTQLETGMKRR